MRLWLVLGIIVSIGTGCRSTTAPQAVQVWNYQASGLTNADGQVTCSFGAALALTQTSGPFTGTHTNGYLSCSSPSGASSTVVSGTVNSGTVSGASIAFHFVNTDVTNTGEVDGTASAFDNTGTIIDNDTQMTGTATATVVVAGQTYTLTGPWLAVIQ